MIRNCILILIVVFIGVNLQAQFSYTHQDSLRGSITPERSWWDLGYYHLSIAVNPKDSSLSGSNVIQYEVLEENQVIQIDLQNPMKIISAVQNEKELEFTKDGFAYFIKLEEKQKIGQINKLVIFFEGQPRVARMPPWSSGMVWNKDEEGNDFIATTCQGDGASLWWPCKDHMYDEVDSMLISITVPQHLTNVSNGRLRSIKNLDNDTRTFNWFVANPINNYGVNINVANYVHFSDTYKGEGGTLDCDYYVLPYNLEKAKKQFLQVHQMFEAFEHWFGPYPFYEDGYKLVEAPYLGMEHQSSVTYGNKYENGYLGQDLSLSGWGHKFDFIIIHESGHEWFANSITYKDIADMWVHEGFTAYAENLYLDYHFSSTASRDYLIGTRRNIQNDVPIIGPYHVNKRGSVDMYYKGANLLHMIRYIIDDDEKWRMILRGLNKKFRHKTVDSKEIETFIDENVEQELAPIFDQYLRKTAIPEFQYYFNGKKFKYRYANCEKGFHMPIGLALDGKSQSLHPTTDWQTYKLKNKNYKVILNRNYLVSLKKVEN